MRTVLITGCNRGLGLGLVRNLAKRTKNRPAHIVTTCRDPEKAEELKSLAASNENVHILKFDAQKFDEYDDFVAKVKDIVKDQGLNVLFNNAGVSSKFSRLQFVKVEQLMDAYTTNTVAPIMLSKALLPLLKQASKQNHALPMGTSRAAIINMSSILASIANSDGGLYPYRCSKAALNMASKTLSEELKEDKILVAALHPGWVRTDMGGKKAPMDVDESTSAIVDLLERMDESYNGGFYQYDGSSLPW